MRKLEISEISCLQCNVIRAKISLHGNYTLQFSDIDGLIHILSEAIADRRLPLILDAKNLNKSIDQEIIAHLAKNRQFLLLPSAVAILVNTAQGWRMAYDFVNERHSYFPLKVFSQDQAAFDWLRSQ